MSEVTVVLNFRTYIKKLNKINEYFPSAKVDEYLLSALRGLHAYCIDPEEIDVNDLAEEYYTNILEREMTTSMYWNEDLVLNEAIHLYGEEFSWEPIPARVVELATESVAIIAEVVRAISRNLEVLYLTPLVFSRINSLRINTTKEHIVITGILNP